MTRDSIATESIYGFASEQATEQPEEPIFVLTSSQLREVIAEATKPLNLRIEALEDRIIRQDEKIAGIETTELQDYKANSQDIRELFVALDEIDQRQNPGPLQRDRGEILRLLLAANGGKMLAKEARKKMHLSPERFSNLLGMCDFIESKPYHLDRRQMIIILKMG